MQTLLAVAVAGLSVAACAGPGGVTVSKDWTGISGVMVAEVNHQRTVIGIDTNRKQARSLIVLPSQASDDDVQGPTIVRPAGAASFVTMPAKNDGMTRAYRVTQGSDGVERIEERLASADRT
jgi:hypothetical protein